MNIKLKNGIIIISTIILAVFCSVSGIYILKNIHYVFPETFTSMNAQDSYDNKNIKKLMKEEKYKEAITEIDKYLKNHPDNIKALLDKSYSEISLDKNEEGIVILSKILSKEPKNQTALNNMSWAYNNLDLHNIANEYADKGLKLYPHDAYILSNKGEALYGLKKYDDALIYFDKAIKEDFRVSYPYWGEGLIYSTKKDYKKSLENFIEYKKMNPVDGKKADEKIANMYIKLKDYNNAIQVYTNELKDDPKNYDAYYSLGDIYYKKGDYQKSIDSYNVIIENMPKEAEAYYYRSISLYKLGKKDEACENLKIAITYDADYLHDALDEPDLDGLREYEKFRELIK